MYFPSLPLTSCTIKLQTQCSQDKAVAQALGGKKDYTQDDQYIDNSTLAAAPPPSKYVSATTTKSRLLRDYFQDVGV